MSDATVTTSPATCYTVLNGWVWARIFVRHGVRQDASGPCAWADVSVISDFGSFGHCWSHIGPGPWQAFLAGLNFDYAMKKLMGPAFNEHLAVDECIEKAKPLIIDARRNGVSKSDARDLWDALDMIGEDYPPAAFLSEWDRASNGAMYRNEMYDSNWTKPSPSAVGFWAEIWPHFVADITAERIAA